MSDYAERIAAVVSSIEAEMRRIQLWELTPPPARALRSQVPFCFDTLELSQWLQWRFVPQMKDILERGRALPDVSDIFPLAEECFLAIELDTSRLLELIKQFDDLISSHARAGTISSRDPSLH